MFVYYLSAFGQNIKPFGCLLLETAATEFTIMSFAWFIFAARYGAVDLYPPPSLFALTKDCCGRANEEEVTPLLRELRANFFKCGLLGNTCDCAVDPLAAILGFVLAGEID